MVVGLIEKEDIDGGAATVKESKIQVDFPAASVIVALIVKFPASIGLHVPVDAGVNTHHIGRGVNA